MANIDLDCPKCGARLQIDESFAGSVCRCSDCGQVMRVPSRAATRETARPNAPGEAPPPDVAPPPEPKRPLSRTTKVGIVLAVLLLVALGGLFYYAMSVEHEDPGDAGSVLDYDPTVNPFVLVDPNVFGVRVEGRVAVAFDASSSSREWLPLAADVAVDLAEKIVGKGSVQFVFWTESPPPLIYPKDGPASAIDVEELWEFVDMVRARGLGSPGAAVEAALGFDPDRIILVTGRPIDDDEVAVLDAAAKGKGDVRIDTILIDVRVPELCGWIEKRGGGCVRIPLSQLREWHRDRY